MSYQPSFQITNDILNIVADISRLLGHWSANDKDLLSRLDAEIELKPFRPRSQ